MCDVPARQADVRDTYAFQVLRLILGEEAARDFFRVDYAAGPSGVKASRAKSPGATRRRKKAG